MQGTCQAHFLSQIYWSLSYKRPLQPSRFYSVQLNLTKRYRTSYSVENTCYLRMIVECCIPCFNLLWAVRKQNIIPLLLLVSADILVTSFVSYWFSASWGLTINLQPRYSTVQYRSTRPADASSTQTGQLVGQSNRGTPPPLYRMANDLTVSPAPSSTYVDTLNYYADAPLD